MPRGLLSGEGVHVKCIENVWNFFGRLFAPLMCIKHIQEGP